MMLGEENNEVMKKAYNTILLGLGNEVLIILFIIKS